jgi:hypothetical protein
MEREYEAPAIVLLGPIAELTLSRCGGTGVNGGGHTPPKDFPWVPHHIDKFGECSATGATGLS